MRTVARMLATLSLSDFIIGLWTSFTFLKFDERLRPRVSLRRAQDARCRVQLLSLDFPRSVSLLVIPRQRERTTSESNLVRGGTGRIVAIHLAKLSYLFLLLRTRTRCISSDDQTMSRNTYLTRPVSSCHLSAVLSASIRLYYRLRQTSKGYFLNVQLFDTSWD